MSRQVIAARKTAAEEWLIANGLDPKAMTGWPFNLKGLGDHLTHYKLRDSFIPNFGFAVLDALAVERLRPYAPFLEVGAGCGYWAHELRQAGIDVVATDKSPSEAEYFGIKQWHRMWCDVEALSAQEAIRQYDDRALLMVWPDFDEPWAAEAVESYPGATVIYVGEGDGGCTGDTKLHWMLENRFKLVERIDIPQFNGIHDRILVYGR